METKNTRLYISRSLKEIPSVEARFYFLFMNVLHRMSNYSSKLIALKSN